MTPKEDQQPMTTREALEPCPFCGGEPELLNGGPGNWFVRCKNCKCSTNDVQRDAAVQLWHRRSALTASPGEQKPFGWIGRDGKFSLPSGMTRERFLSHFHDNDPPIGTPVIPLYLSPPPAGGWDEAEISALADWLSEQQSYHDNSVARNDSFIQTHIARLRQWERALRREAPAPEGVARPAAGGGVRVKPLVWRDHQPDAFPEPAWSAQTSFGFYNIEEVSASDSPAYVVRLHAHYFVADKDSLEDAKAAAQADYEQRILSALSNPPAAVESNVNVEAEFPSWTDEDEAYELGRRDGYELAVQDIDLATGGDGEFKGSTLPGETVDVETMKQRVIERFGNASAEARLREALEATNQLLIDVMHDQEADIRDRAFKQFDKNIDALSLVGDEAKKSEGVPGKQSASGAAAAPIETEDAEVAIRPSDPAAERRELTDEQCAVVCRYLGLSEGTPNFCAMRDGLRAALDAYGMWRR